MKLFFDQDFKPTFEKLAMPVKLSDNPDNWQREIASEVFKQLPYLSDFSVNVVLDRVDQQRGYAFGSAEVTNQTDAPIPDQPQTAVQIPIIVKDRLMQPLDVMLDGKEALPLNERRLREKLFRTASFETSTRKPTDQGMVDQLYPPMRTNYGYGNSVSTGVGVGGFGKQAGVGKAFQKIGPLGRAAVAGGAGATGGAIMTPWVNKKSGVPKEQHLSRAKGALIGGIAGAGGFGIGEHLGKVHSKARAWDEVEKQVNDLVNKHQNYSGPHIVKEASLCKAIAPTISDRQFAKFASRIEGDGELQIMMQRNIDFFDTVTMFAKAEYTSVEKTAQALVNSIKPTVVQFTKQASGGFFVKWANAGAFAPQQAQVGPDQASAMAGQDISGMQPGNTMTVTTERAKKEAFDEPAATLISEFGDYAVKNADTGETLIGTVLPVVDFQMQPLPLFVFTDGASHYATQDEIVGIRQEGPGGMAIQQQEAPPEQGAPPPDPNMQGATQAPSPEANMPKMSNQHEDRKRRYEAVGTVAGGLLGAVRGATSVEAWPMGALAGAALGGVAGLGAGSLAHWAQHGGSKIKTGSAPAQGDGVFVYSPQGGAKPFCTQPITIKANTQGPDGMPQIMAEDVFGAQLTLIQTPGLMSFEPMDEDGGTIAIPDDMQWIPLQGEAVHLAKPDTPDAAADAKSLGGEVSVKPTGMGEFSMDGMPLAKVARDQKWFLKTAEAEFLLVSMGLTQDEAQLAMKTAEERNGLQLRGMRTITPLSAVHEEMTKRASKLLSKFDYDFWTRDVVKEAAALEDSETADKVLAMNFINPENISIFASYLPELDGAVTKLAEMLIASRLGMNQVPEGAAERAMKNMEDVIAGLRDLQQSQLL